jgi:hypothetical protein
VYQKAASCQGRLQLCLKSCKINAGFTGCGKRLDLIRSPEKHPSGAKQAAENGLFPSEKYENSPQGLKPIIYLQ